MYKKNQVKNDVKFEAERVKKCSNQSCYEVSEVVTKTTQIMFIKRLCNHVDAKWKYLSECLMGSSIKHLKWKRLFKNIKNLPDKIFIETSCQHGVILQLQNRNHFQIFWTNLYFIMIL